MSKHGGDCDGTWCDYCGCCEHGEPSEGCHAADAPDGMRCPGSGCGCEGVMGYTKPTRPPEDPDGPVDDAPAQLHQETSLFDLVLS